MKPLSSKITAAMDIGSKIKCDDNSGAKMLRIIAKKGYKGRRGRRAKIRIGDIFFGSVISGKKDMKKKIVKAVMIRQKQPWRRPNGDVIQFEDNAAIVITDKNEPQASEVKGVVAKEVGKRFPKIPTIAKNVI